MKKVTLRSQVTFTKYEMGYLICVLETQAEDKNLSTNSKIHLRNMLGILSEAYRDLDDGETI